MTSQVPNVKPIGPTPIGAPRSAPTPPAWSEGPVIALTFNRTGSTYPLFVARNTSRLSSATGLHELSTDPKVALAQARLLSYNIEGRQPVPVGIFQYPVTATLTSAGLVVWRVMVASGFQRNGEHPRGTDTACLPHQLSRRSGRVGSNPDVTTIGVLGKDRHRHGVAVTPSTRHPCTIRRIR